MMSPVKRENETVLNCKYVEVLDETRIINKKADCLQPPPTLALPLLVKALMLPLILRLQAAISVRCHL